VSEAIAVAHPNVALSKYWGKRDRPGNFPAVPSLSVTLSAFSTRTRVRFDRSRSTDGVFLGGEEATGAARARVVELLDRVRRASGEARCAEVVSENDFPTASGLASSASGFAALALAAVRAAGLAWDPERVSDLARRSSASAARSLFAGFVELPAGAPGASEGEVLSARALAPVDHLPLSVLVAITTEAAKAVGSTDGMRATLERSPYARAWLEEAPRLHARLRDALLARDFPAVGELAEASALAMHACAVAAGVVYWNGATLAALSTLRALREGGVAAYASIDAGPHVKALVEPCHAEVVRAALAATPGVLRVVPSGAGEGARSLGVGPAASGGAS
jgi:diphosphomevalonate decarboxylase